MEITHDWHVIASVATGVSTDSRKDKHKDVRDRVSEATWAVWVGSFFLIWWLGGDCSDPLVCSSFTWTFLYGESLECFANPFMFCRLFHILSNYIHKYFRWALASFAAFKQLSFHNYFFFEAKLIFWPTLINFPLTAKELDPRSMTVLLPCFMDEIWAHLGFLSTKLFFFCYFHKNDSFYLFLKGTDCTVIYRKHLLLWVIPTFGFFFVCKKHQSGLLLTLYKYIPF